MDFQNLIGKTPDEASTSLSGHTVRVVIKDGQRLIVTQDYDSKRINVSTTAGKIDAIVKVG